MVLSPHGNARYFLDGNRPLWYQVHATVVLSPHGIALYFFYGNRPLWYILLAVFSHHGNVWYILYFIFFWVTTACVWCCDASTFTEHENHQTSNLNMKYDRIPAPDSMIFHSELRGEIARCRESQGWTTACSSMPERDGKDQGEDNPKQAGLCWFARHIHS